jgi:putative PIN family toxin of toxin-antitoxin system
VVVSALLRPGSLPARILDLVTNQQLVLLFDHRILYEYRDVLHRPKFSFPQDLVDEFLAFLDRFGEFVVAEPLAISIPDQDDLAFLEVAVTGKADYLITGNKRDFSAVGSLSIVSPKEFFDTQSSLP